jgi:predicted amidohydrolase YtcJ
MLPGFIDGQTHFVSGGKNRNGSYGVKEAHPTKNKNKIFPP